MKILLTLLTVLLPTCILNSQNTKSKGTIQYKQTIVIDTIQNIPDETTGTLIFDYDSKKSIYTWKKKNLLSQNIRQKLEDGTVKGFQVNGSSGTDNIGKMIYKEYEHSVIYARELMDKWYIVEDTVKIQWLIREEQKSLYNMTLQKAECDFRGRHYIAWFNPKIPIPDGPWKLRGLPGLIIEAYDEKKHISFEFVTIELPYLTEKIIQKPNSGISITFRTYFSRKSELMKDSDKIFEAKILQMGGTLNGTSRRNIIERSY